MKRGKGSCVDEIIEINVIEILCRFLLTLHLIMCSFTCSNGQDVSQLHNVHVK